MANEKGDGKDVSLNLLTKQPSEKKVYKEVSSEIIDKAPPLWFSRRFLVAIFIFLCYINYQILRNNINITVVEMISNRSYVEGNITHVKPADFKWDTATIGLIISILSYGGLFSFSAVLLINRFGGSVTCSWSMLLCGILTTLHPPILYLNFYLFLACRFLTGIFEMILYVATSDIFSRWFPKRERSALISFSFNGANVGAAGVYPFCAYLAYTWGWQMVFYVTGSISIVAAILSTIVMKNQPSQDKWISRRELAYILKETDCSTKMNVNHPYKSIFTSSPIWALCIMLFAFAWVSTILGACLPLYIKDVTQKETDEIGNISSIPSIVFIFLFPIDGVIMDYWKNHSKMTLTAIHKIIVSIAFIFSSAMFTAVAVAFTSNFFASVTIFVLVQIPMSFVSIILQVLVVNLAGDHSGVVGGMLAFSYSISAIVCQTITGFMIENHSIQEWNNCFYLAAAISALGTVIFVLFGSSEAQPWALTSPVKEECHLSVTD